MNSVAILGNYFRFIILIFLCVHLILDSPKYNWQHMTKVNNDRHRYVLSWAISCLLAINLEYAEKCPGNCHLSASLSELLC